MPTVIRLVEMPRETCFVPLGMLGYCLTRTDFLAPVWAALELPLKTVDHAPEAKLLDFVVSILAGCRAVSQVNTRLRPDIALARAWGRDCFADQSTLARTLNAFSGAEVNQLRQGSEALFRRESRVLRHNFAEDWLWLDIDLTPLPISKRAEGSTKGKFNHRNRYGRQPYARPTKCLVLRWLTSNKQVKHSIVICSVPTWTMTLSLTTMIAVPPKRKSRQTRAG